MNAIDILCLVLILVFTLLGLWRGFLRSIFRLLAWVAALAGAYFAKGLLSDSISSLLETNNFSSALISICIGFLIPFLLFLFLGKFLKNTIDGTAIGKADRILGGIFGAIKACLISFVLLSLLHIFPFGGVIPQTRDNSMAYSAYKGCLGLLGFSSEPIDLVDAAEKKASALTKSITDKAAEKATEVATETAKKATEAAKTAVTDAAKEAADKATEASQKAINQAVEKTTGKIKETADKTSGVNVP